ncbi:HAMP domain-containing protein, partial [Aureimonas endophytica]|uniref:HAMP domain-containing protein n=1 Tax=Aureimonas endophytica TaxID=2027858 RepID=UPI001668D44D
MLAHLKITGKLIAAFVAVLLVTTLANGILYASIRHAAEANQSRAANFEASLQAERMRASLYRLQNAIGNNLLTGEERFLKTYGDAKQNFQKAAEAFARFADSPTQEAKVAEARSFVETWWNTAGDRMVTLGKDPATRAEALALPKQFPLTRAYDLLDEALSNQQALIAADAASAAEADEASISTMLLACALGTAVAVVMGWLLTRGVARPVVAITGVMRRLSSGDLGVEVPALGRRDEIGAMASAVQVFKEAGLEKRRL